MVTAETKALKPNWEAALYVVGVLLILSWLTLKSFTASEKKFVEDQFKLKINFETILGMYSPK